MSQAVNEVLRELYKPINKLARFYDFPMVADRYTAVYLAPVCEDRQRNYYGYRGMSEDPTSPTGIGTWDTTPSSPIDRNFPMMGGWHESLGKRVAFSDLPVKVQEVVISDLTSN